LIILINEKREKHGDYALRLLEKIIQDGDIVIVSDILIMELSRLRFTRKTISTMFHIIKPNHYLFVQLTKPQCRLAHTLSKHHSIPWPDAAHALLAKEYQAILVSYDSDFAFLGSLVETRTPEELL